MNRSFKSMGAKFTQSRTSRSARRERAPRRTRLDVEALESRNLLNAEFSLPALGTSYEPTVAVNPNNPNVVAVARFRTVVISRDGGQTFPEQVVVNAPNGYAGGGGDPSLAFNNQGDLYFSYLAKDPAGTNPGMGIAGELAVFAARITNVATGTPMIVQNQAVALDGNLVEHDKEWVAVDQGSGNAYLVWTQFNKQIDMTQPPGQQIQTASTQIMFSRTTTGGASWDPPVQLNANGEGFVWPSEVAVATNGDVYVAWHTNTANLSTLPAGGIQMVRSEDSGATFLPETTPFPAGTAATTTNTGNGSNPRVPGSLSWLQGSVQPRILIDPVDPKNVYVVAVDDPDNNYTMGDPSDIVFARSENYGANWTPPITISHAPVGTLQIMPSAAIDQQGNIVVTWYGHGDPANTNTTDSYRGLRNIGNNFLLDVFATISRDGGRTFAPIDVRINDTPFNPDAGAPDQVDIPGTQNRIGEYNGLALANGSAFAVWTGNRFTLDLPNATGQQTFFRRFPLNTLGTTISGIEGLRLEPRLGFESDEGPALGSNAGTQYLAHAGEDGHLYLASRSPANLEWGPALDTGGSTELAPALTSFHTRPFLAWTDDDDRVNVARVNTAPDGRPTEVIAEQLGYRSEAGPALASHGDALYLAHAGLDGKLYLDFISAANPNWGPELFETGEFTFLAPALVSHNDQLFLAWTGSNGQLNVAIVNTDADGRPTGLINERLGYKSDVGPALASHGDALFLAHTGEDKHLYLDFISAADPHRQWGPGLLDTGQRTEESPTLVSHNNQLFLGWTGTDDHLNVATVDFFRPVRTALQTFPVVNGVLTVNGDQLGANFNDNIILERSSSGGVKVTLNGTVAEYAPGVITAIVVNTFDGVNTVTVNGNFAQSPVPVTVNGGGMDRLTFAGALPANPVYTPGPNGLPGDGTLRLADLLINLNSLEFVEGVAPAVPASGLRVNPAVINEDGTVTLSGEFLDPGTFATHRMAVTWGDGVSDPPVQLSLGARSFTLTHRYLDDNPMGTPSDVNTITATVTDNDNLSDTATATVRVNNVAPRLANVTVTPAIDENGVVTLSGDISDTGTQDTFTLVVDWGEGTPQSFTYAAGTTHFSETHQYLDDNPTGTPQDVYAIGLTLTDDDTGQATAAASTLVKNVAPAFTTLGTSSTSAGPAREGEPVTISGAFTDVGTLDTHTVTVDWGDGAVAPAAVTEAGGSGSFSAQHSYQFGGIYPVLVTLRDDDTGEVSRIKAVFVTGVGVHVVGGLTSLQVVGTIGPDQVTIQQAGHDRIRVHADFLDERKRTLPLAGLDIIQVVVLAGNDHVSVAGSVGLPAVLDGGDGDDFLNGSNADGIVIGGRGDDQLNGGNARDILIGGPGADRMVGNGGDDILIGGLTLYDSGADDDKLANDLNLLKLWEEWTSSRPYTERLANLRDGVGPVLGGTGLRLHKSMSVFDDLNADVLTGSAGLDWFFFDPLLDSLNGDHGGEETN